MLVGGVGQHLVEHDLQAPGVGGVEQPLEIRQRAVVGLHALVVGDIVAPVAVGRGMDRREPDPVDAEALDVVELGLDAGQVALAVAVGVEEAADIDVVDAAPRHQGFVWFMARRLIGFSVRETASMTVRRRGMILTATAASLAGSSLASAGCAKASDAPEGSLQRIVDETGTPALAGAVVTREGLSFLEAAGVRRKGQPDLVTTDDKWHLGSNTKAMTAALYGRLVEQGRPGGASPWPACSPT